MTTPKTKENAAQASQTMLLRVLAVANLLLSDPDEGAAATVADENRCLGEAIQIPLPKTQGASADV